MQFFVHARLGVVLSMYILTLWFLPSFAHYFMKPSAALDSIRINLNSVWRKFNFQCTLYLCEVRYARLGVVLSMYILTLWFLPSFAHYFMKPSAALDSIRINFNSVEFQNVNFQCTFLSMHGLAKGSEHVHPNFMIQFSPDYMLWKFQQFWTA